jgi:hypothetical protein
LGEVDWQNHEHHSTHTDLERATVAHLSDVLTSKNGMASAQNFGAAVDTWLTASRLYHRGPLVECCTLGQGGWTMRCTSWPGADHDNCAASVRVSNSQALKGSQL